MDNKTRVIKMYLQTNRSIKQIASNLGIDKIFVGKIINQLNKSGVISYNNYIPR